ncbi:MAG: hypothetical protein ABW208_28125 [Pyrinomonadaceae bacterium]
MHFPRRAGLPALALLILAAALSPGRAAAQNGNEKRAASPNGKIIFQSTQGSDGFVNDIYAMDADGKHQTRLTDSAFDDTTPVWSPPGDKIAFLSDRRGNGYEIYLMDADGSNQRPLRDASPVYTNAFAWSPDGTRLAYADGGNVYVAEVTSGGDDSTAAPVDVSVGKVVGSTDGAPSWSPEGGRLVVSNSTACPGCSDLHIVNASDGGDRIALSTGPGFDAAPTWSPDGSLIAYEADRGGRGIYVIAANGAGTEVKVSGAVGSIGGPVWSPAGARLAFRALSGNNVYAVNADGSGLARLSDMTCSSGDIFWSPDGSKVSFHNGNADNWMDIYVVNADGSTKRNAPNYTKTKRADEFASSWQRLPMP